MCTSALVEVPIEHRKVLIEMQSSVVHVALTAPESAEPSSQGEEHTYAVQTVTQLIPVSAGTVSLNVVAAIIDAAVTVEQSMNRISQIFFVA